MFILLTLFYIHKNSVYIPVFLETILYIRSKYFFLWNFFWNYIQIQSDPHLVLIGFSSAPHLVLNRVASDEDQEYYSTISLHTPINNGNPVLLSIIIYTNGWSSVIWTSSPAIAQLVSSFWSDIFVKHIFPPECSYF